MLPIALEVIDHLLLNWGEPERAPHLRDVRRFCLYVDVYVCVLYILPYISIDPAKMAAVREQCNIRSRQLQMTW